MSDSTRSYPDEMVPDLERQLRRTRRVSWFSLMGVVVMATSAFLSPVQDVIRTRGIIIEDAHGRERILIGAPIPAAANRLRTDSVRVASAWAGRFPDPDQYMRYYATYRHSMHGMLVLDENGMDRLAIGDSTPDPNFGRRIGPATGVQINDAEGFERSGYGLLRVGDKDRVVLGLDSKQGTEGVVLALHDDGQAGLSVYGPGRRLAFVGTSPPNQFVGVTDSLFGFLLRKGTHVQAQFSIDDE